jgi:hypothetical protein
VWVGERERERERERGEWARWSIPGKMDATLQVFLINVY